MKTVSVPARRWYENKERVLSFPDRWDVDSLTSPGLEMKALTSEQIRDRITTPIEGRSLEELARHKKRAVIVFDDMTRPTPVKEAAVHVLETLHAAGLEKRQVRFIWALGAHGAFSMADARKKLGDDIVENYAVYNHDAFQNLVNVGKTPSGVDLWFNREFMSCDLKIGIGCVTPHPQVGFGGGAKIILPGVAGIQTIMQYHNQLFKNPASGGLGNFDGNILRPEIDAAGTAAGLDYKVDCLLNRRGEIVNLFAGPFMATHVAAAETAKEYFVIPRSTGYDISISNAYAKANESAIAFVTAMMTVKPGGQGITVLIIDSPEGQVPHYVFRCWGEEYGGDQYRYYAPGARFVPSAIKKLIVFNPFPDKTCLDLLCHHDDAIFVKTWPEIIALLEEEYPGQARVAVITDGTTQYMKF